MIVAAQSPTYLPTLAYLDRVAKADRFVVLDDSAGTTARIRLPDGPGLLTVPVVHGVQIDNSKPWQRRTWETLEINYRRAPHWARYADALRDVYTRTWTTAVDLDVHVIQLACEWLGIDTAIERGRAISNDGPHVFEHPVYTQRYPERGFDKDLAFIDLVLNHGPASRDILRSPLRTSPRRLSGTQPALTPPAPTC
jgi:hypothetical protein